MEGGGERNSSNVYDYDLICIGCGSAGLACVKEAALYNVKTICLDYVRPSPRNTTWGIGGTCVNCGCIPKKLMHHASLLGTSMCEADAYSRNTPHPSDIRLNWSQLVSEVNRHIKSTNWVIKVQLRTANIPYWNGIGSFIDEHTIKVTMANDEERIITGKYIVIAVGCRPVYPEIPGALEYGITSDDLFSLPKPPGRTLIFGGGYVGCESASILCDFGFDVTLMVREDVLSRFDRGMVAHVVQNLKSRGVRFLLGYEPKSVEKNMNERLEVKYAPTKSNVSGGSEESEVFDTVLFAISRRVLLEDLNIKAVNLKLKNNEFVVDIKDRTNKGNIFALGDAAYGRPKLTPVAILAGRLLARRLFGNSSVVMNYNNVPTSLFTSIEYSFVGLSEEEAIEKYGEDHLEVYHGYYIPAEFRLLERTEKCCYMKVITKREGERAVLGIHFMGPAASEVMTGFAVAMNCGLTANQLFDTVGIHVTGATELIELKITKRSGCDPFPAYYNDMFA